MSFLGWMSLCGGLLLLVALSSSQLRRLPASTAAIYLVLGVVIGPLGFGWLRVDIRETTLWFERLTEVAVIVSLFIGGLKLRLPVRGPAWVAAFRLAGPIMLATILDVALFARFVLGLDTAVALLLGLVAAQVTADELKEPAVAAGVLVAETLSFGDILERLLEVLLVIIVGVCLAMHWDLRAVPLALALFVVIRLLSTRLLLARTATTPVQRWLMGWFGIRGIGSLYYLSYALSHAVSGQAAADACGLTLSVVALSILVHGTTAQPVLTRYERALSYATRVTRGSKP